MNLMKAKQVLPKRYYTIGEVARLLGVEPHVLRFWEKEFSKFVKPLRVSGRRLYRGEQVEVFRRIKALLYEEGYTISGAKKKLSAKKDAQDVLLEVKRGLEEILEILTGGEGE